MTDAPTFIRSLLIYSICLPLAIYLGYLLAEPASYGTFTIIALLIFLLMFPLFLRWHHALLIFSWNFCLVLFFVPGHPELWLAVSWVSLLIGFGQYILNRRLKFFSVTSITRPLLLLVVVVIVTAQMTGGIGLRAFGSELHGGKRYLMMLSAIAGYFAFTGQAIPPNRAKIYISLFFLSGITNAVGEFGPLLGPAFYFLFQLFPVSSSGMALIVNGAGSSFLGRLTGLAPVGSAIFFAMLARYGIEETLNPRRPLRIILFIMFVALSMLGGFRSLVILFALTFAFVFYFEGLMRSRLMPVMVLSMLLGVAMLIPLASHLPFSMQRSLSFLPIPIDPLARGSAESTTEWRLQMWRDIIPDIPNHLLIGKGLGFDAREAVSVSLDARNNDTGLAGTELVGDYHNGPLSVILTFGIFGVIGFLWFIAAALKVLYRNYKYGHPQYHRLNTFLLGYFLAKFVFFMTIFGGLYSELMIFTGIVGLSVSLNRGVAPKTVLIRQPEPRPLPIRFRPPACRPIGTHS